MTENQQALNMLLGVIADMTPTQKRQFDVAYAGIRGLLNHCGDMGVLAVALVGAEIAVRTDEAVSPAAGDKETTC